MTRKIMGNLGSADGAILRCLAILQQRATYGARAKPTVAELNEIMAKLDAAHQAIMTAAGELERNGK